MADSVGTAHSSQNVTWGSHMRAILLAALLATSAVISFGATNKPVPAYIAKAVADSSRPEEDRKLDALRKPGEVLAFAGVKPGQVVGEFLPGGGYYTRLLSDVVGPHGRVYALETTRWGKDNIEATRKVLHEPHRENVIMDLAVFGNFHLPQKVDLFWTTLNYHDLHVERYGKVDIAAFNRHVFDSLKHGGIYLIVDHAATPGSGSQAAPDLHRIDEASVVSEVKAAGFVAAGESDILRNPADDHTKKVFDPAIKWQTDQFVLKFRKP
jgi:predicted methyltransferase